MTQPRSPKPSIKFVDEYCAIYRNIFPEVRSFENFRNLHLGMISQIKRKTLPEIAKVVGLENQQFINHFLTGSRWSLKSLKKRRLELILRVLKERSLILIHFVITIRSNHGVWLPKGQSVRYNKWRKFDRVFSNGNQEVRYIREIIFGRRRDIRYWQVTTDTEKLPENSTWFLMTHVPGIKYSEVGNLYGLRAWVEYGLK